MTKILLSLTLLLSVNSVSAYLIKRTNTRLNLAAGLKSELVDNVQTKARVIGSFLEIDVDQQLLENFKFDAKFGLSFETGSNSSLLVSEYEPENQLYYHHGFVNYAPFSFISLKFGAINQESVESPLFLDKIAFAGLNQELSYNIADVLKVSLNFSQLIPSNQLLSNRLGTIDEGTPKFYIETLGLSLPGDLFGFNFRFSKFSFQTLSHAVAHKSRFLGNQVSGSGESNAVFAYGYKGYNSSVKINFKVLELMGLVYGQYLFNENAPESRNKGSLYGLSLGDTYFAGVELYRNEADSSPAYYNSKNYGHNNIKGQRFYIGASEKDSLRAVVSYYNYSPVLNTLYQSETRSFFLNIDKKF